MTVKRRWLWVAGVVLSASAGCTSPSTVADAGDSAIDVMIDVAILDQGTCVDMDNDGHPSAACGGDDCDDNNPRRNPSAREVCDPGGVDEDCNPCTVSSPTDGDADADGYVSSLCFNAWPTMTAPMGCNVRLSVDAMRRVVRGTDCNDVVGNLGAQQSPGLPEVCNNMRDDNCNGMVDEAIMGTVYRDVDNDGRGDRSGAAGSTTTLPNVCMPMPGWVANNDDCDDDRAETYRGAREICDGLDNDCSLAGTMAGGADAAEDMDRDGHSPPGATCIGRGEAGAPATAFPKTDCDDANVNVNPTVVEDLSVCDGVDQDCNAATSERGSPCPGSGSCGNGAMCARSQGVIQIAVGGGHACVLRNNGGVFCWGNNDAGQLGDGTTSRRELPSPTPALTGVVEITVGQFHTCARRNTGDVYCWGANARGQLGDGGSARRLIPARVTGLTNVVGISAGDLHTCARLTDETVFCWGAGTNGQLGDGTMNNRSTPTLVRMLSGVRGIEAGGSHTCARRGDRRVLCWGANDSGQLGDGTTTQRLSPTEVPMLNDVEQITVGQSHTCARRGGTAVCWGRNNSGQLGDGMMTTTPQSTPRSVTMLTNVVEVEAGGNHTCARRMDNSVSCWGANDSGQLGLGTMTMPPRLVPGMVPMLANVVELAMFVRPSITAQMIRFIRGNYREFCRNQ
jgi:hypothetical protein